MKSAVCFLLFVSGSSAVRSMLSTLHNSARSRLRTEQEQRWKKIRSAEYIKISEQHVNGIMRLLHGGVRLNILIILEQNTQM